MHKFLAKVKRQGSGLHLYFTTEMIRNPKFPLKENDNILLIFDEGEIRIRKVDFEKL